MNNINTVIFLNIDGVLNSPFWYTSNECLSLKEDDEHDLDPDCITRINTLCSKLNAKLIIMSNWKYEIGWSKRLKRSGLQNIIGCTPMSLFPEEKRDDVKDWLLWHKQIKHYLIIDNDTDFYPEQRFHLITVDSFEGFTEDNLKEALELIKK